MLYDLIRDSAKAYTRTPLPYIYAVIIRAFLAGITAFTAVSAVFLLILTLATFGAVRSYGLPATIALAIVALGLFVYFWTALRSAIGTKTSFTLTGLAALSVLFLLILALTSFGIIKSYGLPSAVITSFCGAVFFAYFWISYGGAMVKSFVDAERGQVHLRTYLGYAMAEAPRFLQIAIAQYLIFLLLSLPAVIAFIVLKAGLFTPLGIILLAYMALVLFVVKFFFLFTNIAAVVRDSSALDAVKSGIKFALANAVRAFAIYILYVLVLLTFLVPVVNIFTYITLYPTIYAVMINFYRSRSV